VTTMPCDATEATLMQTPDALYRHKQFPEMVCFVRDASNNLRVVVQFHTWSPGAALVFSEEPCFKRVLRRKLQPVLGEDGLQLTIIGQHHVVAAMVRASSSCLNSPEPHATDTVRAPCAASGMHCDHGPGVRGR
jgi:hypothetical protein